MIDAVQVSTCRYKTSSCLELRNFRTLEYVYCRDKRLHREIMRLALNNCNNTNFVIFKY